MILIIFIIKILPALKINRSCTNLIDSTRSNSAVKAIIHLINISGCLGVIYSIQVLIHINSSSAWIYNIVCSIHQSIELYLMCSRALILVILIITLFQFLILKFILLNIWKIHVYCLLAKFYNRGIIFENIFKYHKLHLHFRFKNQIKLNFLPMHLRGLICNKLNLFAHVWLFEVDVIYASQILEIFIYYALQINV